MKHKIPAVIFAGGKSSRMGEDKALLPFSDCSSLSEYQYQRLTQHFDSVYLSAKSNKFDFECDVVEDRYEVSSPLVALISAFEVLKCEWLFVLSVDVPFVGTDVIDTLLSHQETYASAIVAKSPSGIEPLCGLYHHSVLPVAKNLLDADNHRLTALLRSIKSLEVAFEDKNTFLNLNQPEEYEKALTLIGS